MCKQPLQLHFNTEKIVSTVPNSTDLTGGHRDTNHSALFGFNQLNLKSNRVNKWFHDISS